MITSRFHDLIYVQTIFLYKERKFKLMILCDNPKSAIAVQEAGIDRVFYDLKFICKAERQHERNTVKSNNT